MAMNVLKTVVLASAILGGGAIAAQAQSNSAGSTAPSTTGQTPTTGSGAMERPAGAPSAGPEGNAQNLRGHSDPSDTTGSTASDPSVQKLRGHSETPTDSLKKN